jgi:hypothetical protein
MWAYQSDDFRRTEYRRVMHDGRWWLLAECQSLIEGKWEGFVSMVPDSDNADDSSRGLIAPEAADQFVFAKNNGEIVTVAYVRSRVRREFNRLSALVPDKSTRVRVLNETVGNSEWLYVRSGQTVASVAADACSELLDHCGPSND